MPKVKVHIKRPGMVSFEIKKIPDIIETKNNFWSVKKFAATFAPLALVLSLFGGQSVFAAAVDSNKIAIDVNVFNLSGPCSSVAGQPTGTGNFAKGSVKDFPEGTCLPYYFEVSHSDNSNNPGDITVSPVFDYAPNNTAIDNLETIT